MEKVTTDFLEKFGERVKSIREKRKLTLNDMEFATGIDLSDYNKIEKGKTNITFRTFLKISKGLRINPSVLINFDFDITDYIHEE